MRYIKLNVDNEYIEWMMSQRPTAWCLLCLIARRAKRSEDHPDKNLEIGEAYIGDYKSYGVTEQIYRSDKEFLKTNGQLTTRATNRGTIAKLVNTDIFDINQEKITTKIPKTNGQLTTNNIISNNNNNNNNGNGNGNDNKEKETYKEKEKKVKTPTVSTEQVEIISYWNQKLHKSFRPSPDIENNFQHWLTEFGMDYIKKAISNIPSLSEKSDFWRNMRPVLFFRLRNSLGTADYIETAYNAPSNRNTSEELIDLIGGI